MTLSQFEESWLAKENTPAVFISANNKHNIDGLRNAIVRELLASKGIYPPEE